MPPPSFRKNSSSWTDMSDYVVHFTKDYDDQDAYHNMLNILGKRVISARNRFGFSRKKAPEPLSQKVVCFSEIPLHLLGRLADKRSEYGIVFRKNLVTKRNGNPILYAYKDQPLVRAIKKLVTMAGNDTKNPIWKVTPFIDAPGTYANGSYYFEWEREWRKVGDFTFKTDEVAFLIIPEHLHIKAKDFFENARIENIGPSYDCPFIDAHWTWEKIEPHIPTKTEQA